MIEIHKNDHYAMMLIFPKKCGRPRGGWSENSVTCGNGGRGKEWAKICERPLWIAPNE